LRLFDDKLERIDPGFGFDLITLGASVIEDMQAVQTRLDGAVDDGAELARLVNRLTARLGARAIRAPVLTDSHMPERAEVWPEALRQAPRTVTPRPHRPARLFDTPEEIRVVYAVPEGPPAQFVWRRQTHRVTRFAGPERIAPEWWCDKPGTRLRDYYRIEDQHGRRYWIYRDGVLGDGRGETPRWFVHGGFA
jgi:protein ImuB